MDKLDNIIKESIKRFKINEGYSSKQYQNEIVEIGKNIYAAIIMQKQPVFETELTVPIDETSSRVCRVRAEMSRKEDAYLNRRGMFVFVTEETSANRIVQLLMHEFTHFFDEIKDKETNFNGLDMYRGVRDLYNVPEGIKEIIYHLWIPTEFNAFQTTYDYEDENFDSMFERYMGYLEEAYNIPTTNGIGWKERYGDMWKGVQQCVSGHIPNRYQTCDAEHFKKYFINQSLALMKKLVKKWDGQQNVNFV